MLRTLLRSGRSSVHEPRIRALVCVQGCMCAFACVCRTGNRNSTASSWLPVMRSDRLARARKRPFSLSTSPTSSLCPACPAASCQTATPECESLSVPPRGSSPAARTPSPSGATEGTRPIACTHTGTSQWRSAQCQSTTSSFSPASRSSIMLTQPPAHARRASSSIARSSLFFACVFEYVYAHGAAHTTHACAYTYARKQPISPP